MYIKPGQHLNGNKTIVRRRYLKTDQQIPTARALMSIQVFLKTYYHRKIGYFFCKCFAIACI